MLPIKSSKKPHGYASLSVYKFEVGKSFQACAWLNNIIMDHMICPGTDMATGGSTYVTNFKLSSQAGVRNLISINSVCSRLNIMRI